NSLRGGGGSNILDGGGGLDTAAFSLSPENYYVTADDAGGFTVQGPGETDTLKNIENASFDGTGETLALAQFVARSFDAYRYVASNPDLLVGGYGNNPEAAVNHYMQRGYYEGRSIDSFDPYQYVASNLDLLAGGFGNDPQNASRHYV